MTPNDSNADGDDYNPLTDGPKPGSDDSQSLQKDGFDSLEKEDKATTPEQPAVDSGMKPEAGSVDKEEQESNKLLDKNNKKETRSTVFRYILIIFIVLVVLAVLGAAVYAYFETV